jgi:short-subunit dehydrogenase
VKNPKTILITGASSGIGKGLAIAYAKPGRTLYLFGRDEHRLQQVAEAAEKKGANVVVKAVDVMEAQELAQSIQDCDEMSPLDLVIANAGVSNPDRALNLAKDQRIFDVNLQGVLNTIHPIIPLMLKRKRGQIAMMSSMAGYGPLATAPAYCAAKGAVKNYGIALSGVLMDKGIEVSVICPGFIRTPLTDKNPFPMPLLMEVEKSLPTIMRGLEQEKLVIAFPKRMQCLAWLMSILPATVSRYISRKV